MSKKVFVLVHDYWHHDDSIKPMMNYLFNADYEVTFTKNPNDYFKGQFDLFLSFKDPIENDQIPTPIWCDEKWTEKFLNDIQNGMGTIMLHASLTDYTENHAILTNVVRSNFITHPEQCPLTVKPIAEHPIIEGIGKFTFPDFDEHYHNSNLYGRDDFSILDTVLKEYLPKYFTDVTKGQVQKWQDSFNYKAYNDYITGKLEELDITVENRKRKFDHFVWYLNR